ncbi:DUF6492 family protein [Rhizobium lusitanum]|uniref:Uncharacterized protein n=1 Tax=Rhizobium lusitanum TaxID=293958 RepID=A0A7X0IT57_9HYPH|nr:DUF6492 family protein [Rhizobium lusitanum]MBB6486705.1 hypothetical protein [Rhizobium lusitanum]
MKIKVAILAVDNKPNTAIFFDALLRSLEFFSPISERLDITVIGEVNAKLRGSLNVHTPEEVCQVSSFPGALSPWYREQLAGLYFAAGSAADYSLVLPVGAFAISPLSINSLLPRLRARTTWEAHFFHPEWWGNAKSITRRLPPHSYEGPTVFPGILNGQLARWALDIVRREHACDSFMVLSDLALSGRDWSAMSVYATAAGSRFMMHHHDPFASKGLALMSEQVLWSGSQLPAFDPAHRTGNDSGLFTYVHLDEISEAERVLSRLFACLKPYLGHQKPQ